MYKALISIFLFIVFFYLSALNITI